MTVAISLKCHLVFSNPGYMPEWWMRGVSDFSRVGGFLPEAFALLVVGLGVAVLVGWGWDVALLKSFLSGEETMKVNTAVALYLLGAALFCVARKRGRRAGRYGFFHEGALVIAGFLGLATLVQYMAGVQLGIDELVFRDSDALSAYPGRMAPNTALAIMVGSLGIFLAGRAENRDSFAAGALFAALFLILVAALAGLGYTANFTVGYRWGPVAVMAAHTAIGVALLGVGMLAFLGSRDHVHWHLRAPLTGTLLVGVMLLICVALLGWETLLRWRATNEYLVQTLENRHRASGLSARISEFERAQKGFRLYGEGSAETNVHLALQAVEESLLAFRQMLNFPDADALVDRLGIYLEEKIALDLEIMAGGEVAAQRADPSLAEASRLLMVEIAALFSSIDEHLRASGDEAALRMRAHERRVLLFLPVGTLFSLFLIAVALALFNAEAGFRQEGETRFRGIFDTAFQFIGLLRSDGIVLEANKTALDFIGVRGKEVIGKHFLDTPWFRGQRVEQRERVAAAFQRAVAGEASRFAVGITGEGDVRHVADYSLKPLRNAAGEVGFVVAEAHDITELKETQEKLFEAEQRWDAALAGSELGVWDWNPISQKCYYSPHYLSMLGYGAEDFGDSGEDWSRRVHPEDYAAALAALRDHLEGRTPTYAAEFRMQARDGSWKWILDRGKVMLRDAAGRATRMVGTHTDITARREVLEHVSLLQRQLEGIIRFSPNIISLIDCDGRYLLVGDRAAETIGLPVEEIRGRLFEEVLPPEVASLFRSRIERMRETPVPLKVEDVLQIAGEKRIVETQLFPLFDPQGALIAVGGIAMDITEQRAMLVALQSALEEREVLLREIHHRVKNNLQVISSLLNIQARHLPEAELRAPFEECRRRIVSMSLIHDQLYRRQDIGRIDFGHYLEELVGLQRAAFGLSADRLEIRVGVDVPPLDIALAVSCGLIVNELLSNACKHAFPDERTGQICISLLETDDQWILSVEDNGIGNAAQASSGDGLGMELVAALTRQLKGRLAYENSDGCRVCIRFPAPLKSQRTS